MTSSSQQTKWTPYKGGTFAPIDQESYVEVNQAHANQQSQSLGNYHHALRMNDQRLAAKAGKQYEQLAQFSEKAGEFLGMAKEKRDKRRKAEAIEWHMINGLPQDQIDEYHRGRNQIREEYKSLVGITENDPEMDTFTKERFINLAPWKQLLVMEQEVAARANTYQLDGDPRLDNALDPTEYHAALAIKNAEFLEQFGDINPALLEEHLFKKMRTVQEAHAKTWTANRGVAMEDNRQMAHNSNARDMFQSESGGAVDAIEILTAEHQGNKAKARDTYFDNREADIANGLGSFKGIEAIGEEVIDGVKIKDHHAYKGRLKQLKDKLVDYHRDEWKRQKDSKRIAGETEEAALIDALPPLPEHKEVKNLLNTLKRKYPGQKFSKLEGVLEDSTLEATTLETYRDEAKAWADRKLLTKDRLAKFPWQIQREFADVAQMQTTVSKANKAYLNAVEQMVLSKSATFPNGKAKNPTAIILAARMQNHYMDQLSYYMQDDKLTLTQQQQYAFQATQAEFATYKKSRRGWDIGLPSAEGVVSQSASILATRNARTEALEAEGLGALTEKGLFGDAEQLIKDQRAIQKGYTPSWIKEITNLYPDLDDIDVYNMYAKQMEVPLMKHPEGPKDWDAPTKQKIKNLKNNPTAGNAAIAFANFDTQERLNLFYSEEQQKLLEGISTDWDINESAAAYDFLYSDPMIMKMFNIKEESRNQLKGSRSRFTNKDRPRPDLFKAAKESDTHEQIFTQEDHLGNVLGGAIKAIKNSRDKKRLDDQEKLDAGWTFHQRRGWIPPKSTDEDRPLFTLTEDQMEAYDLIEYKFGIKAFD